MALFGLNWEESKWPGHFCSIVLYFFASKIGVKLSPGKKVPWHWRWASLSRGPNCHFFQKNAFFRVEKGIFSKSSFYTKMFSDPKYSFSVCQKYFFAVSKKVSIFHHSEPSHPQTCNGYLFIILIQSICIVTIFRFADWSCWGRDAGLRGPRCCRICRWRSWSPSWPARSRPTAAAPPSPSHPPTSPLAAWSPPLPLHYYSAHAHQH